VNKPDPVSILKLMNPLEDEGFTEDDARRMHQIMGSPPLAGPRRPSGRRRWIAAGVASLAMLSTAAFAVIRTERASDPTGIVCYRNADVDSDRAGLAANVDPVAACVQHWDQEWSQGTAVPPLVACVNDGGVVAVFPGADGICAKLGLAELARGQTDEQSAVVALQDDLAAVFTADCYRQRPAIARAQELLKDSGLEGWTVQLAENFPPGLECAGPGVLPDTKTVLVLGARPEP
jgi:hypothetical protein